MKKQQKNRNNTSLNALILVFLLLVSCSGNQICFDIKKQLVCSKHFNTLGTLYINTEKGGDLVIITERSGKTANEYFSFEKMDTLNYLYEKSGYISKKINNFYLKPNTTYEVENKSDGDAAGGKLTIKTNSTGKVVYSSAICD